MMLDDTGRNKRNQGYHMNIGLYVGLLSYIKVMIDLAVIRKDEELQKHMENAEEKLLSLAEKENGEK